MPGLKSLGLFVLVAALGAGLVWQSDRLARSEERQAAAYAAATAAFGIEQQLSRALSTTYALAAMVRQHGDIEGFEALAAEMMPLYGGLSSLQLAPGCVIRQVFPPTGNEAAIGHDLLSDPDRRFQAKAAVESRQLTLAGPFELRQGGTGMVGRLAVYVPDAKAPGRDRLWGLVTAVVLVPDLLRAAQVGRLADAGYAFELARHDPETGRWLSFAGTPLAQGLASIPLKVPNGDWRLSIAPAADGHPGSWVALQYATAILGAALLALLSFAVLRQPEVLRREVAARTAELAADVEQRRRAEEELGLTQRVVDRATVAIAWVGPDGRFLYANAAFARLGGAGGVEKGALLWEAFPAIDREAWSSIRLDLDRATSSAREVPLGSGGAAGQLALTVERLQVRCQELFAIYARDVSAERRAEEQVRQAEKLDAIGQLAGGIAHDFNNLLTGILGHSAMLLDVAAPGSEVHEAAQTITSAARRGAELTRALLGFARRQRRGSEPFDVHGVVQEVSRLLARTVDKRIRIVERLEARPSMLVGDAGQLQQALLNLAVNARDAMPAGGDLVFSTRVAEAEATDGATAPRKLLVGVADTGHGIPAEIRERVFEPFFTTKGVGQGTGMGLAMVYGFARSHGGTVLLDSEPGRGTRFTLRLPLSEATQPRRAEASAAGLRRGTGLVIVIDDDDAPRSAAEGILRRAGYEVVSARGGQEGLHAFRLRSAEVRAVLLDLSMPGMDGEACLAALREADASLPVVITTGLDRDGRIGRLAGAGKVGLVLKPFTPAELAEAIAVAAAGRRRAGPAVPA